MKSLTLKNFFRKNPLRKEGITNLSLFILGLAILFFPSLNAYAEDIFKAGRTEISDTFGKNSTVIFILYLFEIIVAIYIYTKSKNLGVFAGIAIIMVFVNVAFGVVPK